MIKKSLFLATCLLLVFPVLVSAGEGSDTVGDGNLLLQLRYEYIDNDYETEYEEISGGNNDFDFFSHSVYLQADYGLTDNVDVYGLLGYRYLDVDVDAGDIIDGNLKTLLWGVGVKSTFYRADNGFYFGGGLGLKHAFTPGHNTSLHMQGDDDQYMYQELNLTADLHAGWRFENGLNPYFGVEYRHTWMYLEQMESPSGGRIEEQDSGRFEQERNVGVYAGLDYYIDDRFFLNIEGHALDYWGASASFGYLFGSPFKKLAVSGEGSDTIGGGNVLLQLKYAYFEDEFDTEWDDLYGSPNEFDFTSHSVYLQLDYGITDAVDIYGLMGYKIIDASIDADEVGYGSFDTFLWGAGLKSTFYRADCGFYVGGGLGVTYAFTPDTQTYRWGGDSEDYEYSELNLTTDLHVGYRFEKIGLTPYAGVEFRYTWANLELFEPDGEIDGDSSGRLQQEEWVGVLMGLEYIISDRFFLNLEGHMVNRWGGSVGFGYMFDL